jgi:hypothetical protein
LFPDEKRATAIGICQLVARGLTILSPEEAELPAPQPMLIFCGLVSLALLTTFTFPDDHIKPTDIIKQ